MDVDSDQLTLEAFHERIHSTADEREDIQKRTFTRWINSHLKKNGKVEVADLFGDFCNGKSLLALLEVLSGSPLAPEKGRMRVHFMNNVNKAVNYLTDKCGIRLVNISSDDVVNGNAKLILGLVWTIISHWQVNRAMADLPSGSQESVEKTLLAWCRSSTEGYSNVNIQNFTTSWSDGFAFNALIHSYRPELFDYDELIAVNDVDYTLIHAFHIADNNFQIAKLLEPKDMERPDKKSVLLYVTCLYKALHPTDQLTNEIAGDSALPGVQPANQTTTNQGASQNSLANQNSAITASGDNLQQETVVESSTATSYMATSLTHSSQPSVQQNVELHEVKLARLADQSDIACAREAQSDVTSVTMVSHVSSHLDLTTTNSMLETTLTWLHEAKDKFNNMMPVADSVDAVKVQFHEHEQYMMELTHYQSNVGSLLSKGNSLVMSGDLSAEQEATLRSQLEQLNHEWEELRVGAMERQTSLQQSLMDLQMDQLNDLSSWLSQMEVQIENFDKKVENFETLDNVKKCFEEHKKLQESLEQQQDRVSSLQNMVVIVEDGVQDPVITNKSAYMSMERMLEDLGVRWTNVCHWIDEKWRRLHDIDVKWMSYHNNARQFDLWLTNNEVLLGRMRLSDISDPQILLHQVQHLKDIEGELNTQMAQYNELNKVGQTLISYLPSFPQTTVKIQTKLEEYKRRWDSLVQQMQQQSKAIGEAGVNPEDIISAAAKHKQEVADKYDALERNLSCWLDDTEQLLQLQGDTESTSGSVHDKCEQVAAKYTELKELQDFVKRHDKELGESRLESQHTLCERWTAVTGHLQEMSANIDVGAQCKETKQEMAGLEELLQGYRSWINNSPNVDNLDAADLSVQLEECETKLKSFTHDEQRLKELYSMRHRKHVMIDDKMAADISKLSADWTTLRTQLEEREMRLSQKLNQAPPRKYLDATEALITWLGEVEEVLAERVYINDISTMEKNVSLYQDLQKAITEHVTDVEYVNKTGEDLVKRSSMTSTGASNSLQLQLSSLNSRWQAISHNIQGKLSQLTQAIEKLRLFESQVNGLTRWMSDMEHFLQMEQPVVGDKETLQAQINQSDGALADIETLQAVVEEINTNGQMLVAGSEEAFGAGLKAELEKMNDRWTQICKMSQAQNELLKDALTKSANLVENISELNTFLTDFDVEVSQKLVFSTKADLDISCEKVKTLEKSLESKRDQLKLIQTLSTQLMERSRQDSLPRLLNRLKHMDSKWEHIWERLTAMLNECSEVSTRYSDFLSLVQSEEMYISQIEGKLNSGDDEAVDAEDMAAEMDELESLLEERDKQTSTTLSNLSTWFRDNGILIAETQSVKSELEVKVEEVMDKARERVQLLERTSQKSQDTELKLAQMETWMNEVNGLFRDWTDQDLLAGDLPDDFKTLKGEFDEKDEFLKSIETQIRDFRALGKTLAAERLEKKLEFIKEDYAIAQMNFLKWQRPIDFDPKFRRTQQQLHEIDDKIYLIEIFSEDPEHVGIRLEQCTKFYTVMSEIKTEVEYVIKTGRQLVEKKQVNFPRRVNQSLDALKSLYNRLGAKISQARKDLDKAFKISKVITKHVLRVTELVENTETRLTNDIQSLDVESSWVQETEREFEKVHPSLTAITTLYSQFEQFAEESALDEAKESYEQLKERWQNAIQALAARQRAILAQRSNADADLEMFVVKSTTLLSQMESMKKESEQPGNIEKLQVELVNLKEEMTTLDETAANISCKGDNYQERVTPVVQTLHSNYKELANTAQLGAEDIVIPVVTVPSQQAPSNKAQMRADHEASQLLVQLKSAVSRDVDKYELASMFAQCEAGQSQLSDDDNSQFLALLADWNKSRDSTVERWQCYELHWIQMSMRLGELENKLFMAQTQPDLLSEIEEEIARRQGEINALNEQAEDLTEHDTPPIDQHLLQLNQRWVGIRSQVANFKPTNSNGIAPHTNGTATLELSPPTKQKYEYAVINKNRKNQSQVTVTPEISIETESAIKRDMSLDLCSSELPTTNNNVLFVTSPAGEHITPTIAAESQTAPLDGMQVSTSSKRYIVETDLDEVTTAASMENVNPALTAAFYDSVSDDEEKQDDYRKMLSRVGILQQQLNTSGIDIDQFTHENFTSSQDLLASVKVSMQVLEKDMTEMESKYQNDSSKDSTTLDQSAVKLHAAWGKLNDLYITLHSNLEEAFKLWAEFHSLFKIITTWLDSTEKILKRTRDRSGELMLDQAKNVQKDLEEGMSQNQSVIHNLARTAITLASKLVPNDAERITDKVSRVTNRWKDVTVEVRSRKPRVDSMSDSGKCLDVMDDLSFWLDETEIIITTSPDYTDQQSLADVLEKVKDRADEIPHKREALEFVSKSAKDLWSLPELGPEDKLKIGRDMERVNRKWSKITVSIEERQRHLEKSIETLEDILFDIGILNGELWQAIEDLGPKMGPENFNNIKDMFPRNQAVTIETLSIWYREVLLMYKRLNAILPQNMEAHFRRLTMKWTAIKERTLRNRADSDSSIEETLATGSATSKDAVSADDIFEEPRQSVFMDDHLQIPKLPSSNSSMTTEDEMVPPPPPRRESLQQRTEAELEFGAQLATPMNREVTLALLKDRLVVLNRTVSNRRVEVLDKEQITESEVKVSKLTVAVEEILRQLSMFPEADNQVSGLRTECKECHTRSVNRSQELKQLLIDSHKYGDQMAKVDVWLCEIESKIDGRKREAIGDAVDVVDRQIQQHEALEMEVESWKDNYDILNRMTDNLLSTYPQEDTGNLKQNAETFSERWTSIQSFIAEQSQVLSSHRQMLEDYDGLFQAFILWLTEQEAVAEILLEEVKVNDPVRSSTWALRSKDLQSQIESHQRQHELLRLAGKKMSNSSDSSVDGEDIKRHLDEMNERWSQLRAKTVQIRCRLESSMDQWSELLTRCRQLIEYLNSRENALIAARPVSGNLPGVKQQIADHQQWKIQLESKTSDFEHTISTGRFYLEREGADRRLSSASCDSRIMDELTVESSDAKSVIKNIRRHIRLLNQKWLELHNKSERWNNQLVSCEKNLEALNNLLSLAIRHLNEIDGSMQSWKPVHDYPVSDLTRQLTTARSLRRKNEEVSEVVAKAKAIIRTHDNPVDMDVKQSIVRITERQEKVEKQLGDRVSQLVSLNRTLVPEVNDLLKDSVSRPYERSTTPAGVPYYINHDKKTTQWDHPRMVNLLAQLPKFNATKFSAYRTAQKLRKMQKALGLNSIRLKDVIKSCQEHKIVSSVGEEIIDMNLIISCLRDLFEHLADDRHASGVNVPLSIDLSLNWLLNVYDLGRQGKLRALSFQVGLVIMCRGAVEDKFNYLLSCLGDKSGLIDERKLSLLLSDCIQIPRQLGEVSSFGGANIDPSVQSCLEQAKGATCVNTRQFMDWLALEPQSMVWLPVYHRLATSESCKHQAKCSLCKTTPIIGLRYRCLRCFNFNLCQTCFFAGKKGKAHKLNHPMKEYYCSSTSNDEMKDLSSPMRKKYSSGRYIKKHNPKGYLPLSKLADGDSTLSRDSLSMMSDIGTPSSPPSIHIQYEMNSSISSHDGVHSQDTVDLPKVDVDIHEDIERYAHTLDRLESQNKNNGNSNQITALAPADARVDKSYANTLPSTSRGSKTLDNDEHEIIERYCSSLTASPVHKTTNGGEHFSSDLDFHSSSVLKSPMQIVMSLEDSQKTELEAMIKDLEDENRNLQNEYQRLQAERDQQPTPQLSANGDREAEMLAEAMMLRQHKGRLEGRMKILEDHNKQLEAQLRKLRHLLEQPGDPAAREPVTQTPHTSSSNSPLRVTKLPPTYGRQPSEQQEMSAGLAGQTRAPKLHGSIGELFQMAGQVGKAVGQFVSVVSDQSQAS